MNESAQTEPGEGILLYFVHVRSKMKINPKQQLHKLNNFHYILSRLVAQGAHSALYKASWTFLNKKSWVLLAPFAGNNRTPSVQGDASERTRNELWISLGLKSQLILRNPEIPYGAAMALHYVLNLPPLSIFSPLVSHFGIFTQSPRIFLNSVSKFFLVPEYPLSISYPSPLLYCVCESPSCV